MLFNFKFLFSTDYGAEQVERGTYRFISILILIKSMIVQLDLTKLTKHLVIRRKMKYCEKHFRKC